MMLDLIQAKMEIFYVWLEVHVRFITSTTTLLSRLAIPNISVIYLHELNSM